MLIRTELQIGDVALPLQLPPEVLGPDAGVFREPQAVAAPEDDSVFVGVIDDGVGFAHERFRTLDADGAPRTRVDMLWLMGADHDPSRRACYGFGRELFAAEIDALLSRRRLGSSVDEASLYRDAGAVRMMRRPRSGPQTLAFAASHGTAVTDLAAGFRADDPRARRVRLLLVSLPPSVTEDTSGAFVEGYVAMGVHRILRHIELADISAGRRHRAVIVIPLATTAGAKDGGSLLDQIMTAVARVRAARGGAVTFVLPAGNARQDRLTATVENLVPGETRELVWRLQPDDRTPCFVEIYGEPLPEETAARLEVGLAPPGGATPAWLPKAPADPHFVLRSGDREMARAYMRLEPAADGSGRARQRVVLVAPPTVADRGAGPPGDWRIVLRATGDRPLRADLFIQRDDTLPGFRRRGRQSRFVDPGYAARGPDGRLAARDPDPPPTVRRAGTLNALACASGPEIEAVGGLVERREQDRKLPPKEALYSGLGFTTSEYATGPRYMEISERSVARPGILAAATTSGPRLALGGTSVAAPQRARRRIADPEPT